MMEQISAELKVEKIPFDIQGNRIQYGRVVFSEQSSIRLISFNSYFPHIINIAVKAGLKHLTKLGTTYNADVDYNSRPILVPQELQDDVVYWEALEDDVVAAAQNLVGACRESGQRREDLANVIKAGNKGGGWGEPPQLITVMTLLKDVETHWSLTFLMIDRLLELNLVSLLLYLNSSGLLICHFRLLLNFYVTKSIGISHIIF